MPKPKMRFGNEGSAVTMAPEPPAAPLTAAQFVKCKTPMKRLVLEIPAELHHRMKMKCAQDRVVMAEVVRAFLEKRFPADPRA